MINKLILWAASDPKNELSQTVLKLTEELEFLKKELSKFRVAAYARVNERGDLYDLRLNNNPYNDQNTVLPLYVKNE